LSDIYEWNFKVLLLLEYYILIGGLASTVIGILILGIISISINDPLHTINTRIEGTVDKGKALNLSLQTPSKRNLSLFAYSENISLLNAKVFNPRDENILNNNFSRLFFSSFLTLSKGNYSAELTNLQNNSVHVSVIFGSTSLFNKNGEPNLAGINTISVGVILVILGILVSVIGAIFSIVRKIKYRYKVQ
jgi:hypothetical protein